MTKISPVKGAVQVQGQFARPILSWRGVPERFFESIYSQLGEFLLIKPGDFFIVDSNNLGEVRAGFRIYGGNRGIAITCDSVLIDFPDSSLSSTEGITESDLGFVNFVIQKFIAALIGTLPDLNLRSARASAGYHYNIADGTSVHDYLKSIASQEASEKMSNAAELRVAPGYKYHFDNTNEDWYAIVSIEKSIDFDNALYFFRDISFLRNFERDKIDLYFEKTWEVERIACDALGLEIVLPKKSQG